MRKEQNLKILHAGALRKPMKECVRLFTREYPQVRVTLDYAGSRACARALLEGCDVDVIALADPHVFDDLLVPRHVDVFFVFATDRMVLAYDELAKYSGLINEENWMEILSREDVTFARSDENLDPCGYRALMLWQLAGEYYNMPGLYQKLDTKCGPDRIYPKSIDLTSALLEGRVDYAFSYSSVAEQFGFRHVEFPSRINLSNPAQALHYSRAVVTLEKVGKESQVKGAPIEFAVAVPRNSSSRELARQFIEILTSSEGEEILEDCGLIPC
ncbi:MAG: molybdenum ABC transporter substrate-binding protein [Peptococcaceae bacterium BICA1-7]|nr:MAG: molybdenum ABC transporter substrate-binding protein [Peptococcaceae bacterium BICA1-7]HBV97516.1 molybdenum ABC transporter substrate-binding protein [Desulfotomaculum sp.]